MTGNDPAKILKDFRAKHDFFIGVDSDGCVFDTMGIKQRECFCPWLIACFDLQPVAQAARECKEFADLFSKTRGSNRHKTLKRILAELLPSHPMVKVRNFKVPHLPHYFAWVDDPKSFLSDAGLKQAIAAARDTGAKKELSLALDWSTRVNQAVKDIVRSIPPFPYVKESLERAAAVADIIVVSATPYEALEREWREHDIACYASVIAGQEMGTKAEHIQFASGGKYKPGRVLIIGDALGDLKAARANEALFYPVNPGDETTSWKRFCNEALDRFMNGRYAGPYEEKLIGKFEALLPERPPWEN